MSTSLISIFLSLELLSLFFYILAGISRNASISDANYLFADEFVVTCFLFGAGLFFSHFGTLDFCRLDKLFFYLIRGKQEGTGVLIFGCLLIFIYFVFKLLTVQFYLAQSFVYFGAPVIPSILFCVINKLVIFTPLLRISVPVVFAYHLFAIIFLLLGFFIFIYGLVRVFFTDNLKWVLIYSSMVQVSFPICLIGSNTESAFITIYFFVIIESLVSIVAWSAYVQLLVLKSQKGKSENNTEFRRNRPFSAYILKEKSKGAQLVQELSSSLSLTSLSGLWFINPLLVLKFIFVFFSFVGIPPLVGFLTKNFIFYGILKTDFFLGVFFEEIFIFALFGSFIAFYYLRLIKIMFEDPCSVCVDVDVNEEDEITLQNRKNRLRVFSFSSLDLFELKFEDGLCFLVIVLIFVLLFNIDAVLSFGYQPVCSLFFDF